MPLRKIILVATIIWLVIGSYHVNRTRNDFCSHDYGGHIQYTETIVKQGRLPRPYEFWGAYQLPLYYLIDSFIASSSLKSDKEFHIKCVRYLSVVYGAVALWAIGWFLELIGVTPLIQLLILLFIATTPKFVFIFSTYNNDSLLTMICTLVLSFAYRLNIQYSRNLAIALFLVSAAGMYVKHTYFVFFLPAVIGLCCINILRGKFLAKNQVQIVKILLASLILIIPYLSLHYYKETGKFLPSNNEFSQKQDPCGANVPLLDRVFRIPVLTSSPHEWDEPWVNPHWNWCSPSTKRNSYLSFVFITSVIGEHTFRIPETSVIWVMLLIHLIITLFALRYVLVSDISKLAGLVVLFSHILHIASMGYFLKTMGWLPPASMDYRYISWNWIAWAALYSFSLQEQTNKLSKILSKILIIGIIVHLYFLTTVVGNWE